MKKLDNPQVGVRRGDSYPLPLLNALGNIKLKALKAAKAIALAAGGITTSLVLGTTSLASTNKILNRTATNGATVVQSHTRDEQDIFTKAIEINPPITPLNAAMPDERKKSPEPSTPSSNEVGGHTKPQATTHGKTGDGKLTLVNDTPSPMLIYLIPPRSAIPKRYAYVSGCTKRQLTNEYSTGWRFTTDLSRSLEIKTETTGGELWARASRLSNVGGVKCLAGGEVIEAIRGGVKALQIPADGTGYTVVRTGNNTASGRWSAADYVVDSTKIAVYCKNIINQCYRNMNSARVQKNWYTSPVHSSLLKEFEKCANFTCGPSEKNSVLMNILRNNKEVMRNELYTSLQNLAVRGTKSNGGMTQKRNELLQAIMNAAADGRIYETAVQQFKVYLSEECRITDVNGDLRITGLLRDWKALQIAENFTKTQLFNMGTPAGVGEQVVAQTPLQPTVSAYITTTKPCTIKERGTSDMDKVVSYKPDKQ